MHYSGLSALEAQKALQKFGANEIAEYQKRTVAGILFNQIKSPLIFVLIIASIISTVIGDIGDSIFIILIVIINSSLGFFQEYRAENTLSALRKTISKTVRVIRGSEKITIPAREIVPGDIVILESGLNVPADCTILEATELSISEALLTGESAPIYKKEKEKAYKGTLVLSGFGFAKVASTGMNTEFGKIAKSLTHGIEPDTPTRKRLASIGRILTIAIVVVSVLIFLIGILNGMDFNEILATSVALGVSTIPEGLLIAYTITLALGMNRLLEKRSVVKNLHAAETLGSIDVLCIDKTGTITLGEMKVSAVDIVDEEAGYTTLAMCSSGNNFIDNAVNDFLLSIKDKNFITSTQDKRIKFFPFSSENKYSGAHDGAYLYAVGAPEQIMKFCVQKSRRKWDAEIHTQSLIGNRIIAVARKKQSTNPERKDFKGMTFLGLVFIDDPVRDSAATSLVEVQEAGVDIKVITGDLIETSLKVLEKIGLKIDKKEAVSGFELLETKDQEVFDRIVMKSKLFYRTTPEQKLSIVKSLQRHGKKVGMMGDGVNDSPALKNAEIGIAVDTATDVSKEAADVVLLDSNLQTIIDSIEEGRNIFKNLRRIFVFIFSDSLTETILILSALLLRLPLPLTALQLLWINIIEDGLPSLALSFERTNKKELLADHSIKKANVFDRKTIGTILIISIVTDFLYLILFKYLIDNGYDLAKAQTFVFSGIALSSLLFLYSVKSLDRSILNSRLLNNKWLNLSFLLGIFLLFLSIYWQPLQNILKTSPLEGSEVVFICVTAIIDIILIEIAKLILHSRKSDQVVLK